MRRTVLALALCCSFAQAVQGQEPQPHAPWLNAFGRFWGIGYSAGYHAQTSSRLGLQHYSPDHNVVPQPPRGLHATPNYYAHPVMHGQVYGPAIATPMSGPAASAVPGMPQPNMPQSNMQQNLVPAPAKPVEPPPNWLRQYMKPNEESGKSTEEGLLNDNSPSDRKGVMLTPSPEDSTTGISITPVQPPIQIGGRPVISILQQ